MSEQSEQEKRYKIICPVCKKVQYACKSIAHRMGLYDLGHATCLGCKSSMRLVFDPENQTMKAKEWEI